LAIVIPPIVPNIINKNHRRVAGLDKSAVVQSVFLPIFTVSLTEIEFEWHDKIAIVTKV